MLRTLSRAAIFTTCLVLQATTLFGADDTLPPLIGDLSIPKGDIPFSYGNVVDGLSVAVWSESPEYYLNHRINVWISLRTAKYDPSGRSLMVDDPLFKESFLFVTSPDGTTSRVPVSGPIDGIPGAGFSGGVSDHLHRIVRKPGVYKVQWKVGDLASGIVTFTVLPEADAVTRKGRELADRLAAEESARPGATYKMIFQRTEIHGDEIWFVYKADYGGALVSVTHSTMALAYDKTTGKTRRIRDGRVR